jgi:PAS domain S-box-containing protein
MIDNPINSERSNHLISNIYRISSLLTEPSLVEKALTSIMETVKYNLGFERCSIYLINKEKMLLECKFITGFTDEQKNIARSKPFIMHKHDCIETRVATLGKSLLIRDHLDPNITKIDGIVITQMDRKGCTLYVPLKVKGEIIGILGVNRKQGEAIITEKEIESLSIFVNFASIIIENSRLYEALLKEKKFSEDILNSSINGILTTDIQGRITSLNPAAESILGIRKSHVLNTSVRELFVTIPELSGMLNDPIAQVENIKGCECVLRRDNEKFVILRISSSPIFDDIDSLIGILFLIQDVTAEREREKHLQRMSRLISLGELAAGVAHEIRNPLTGISVVLDILRNRQRLSKSEKSLLEEATIEIERLEKIVSDLLDFARPQKFNFEMANIVDIIKSMYFLINEQCNKQNIRLLTRYSRSLPKSFMDHEKMKQGLLNILINAIQAMPQGGKLSIEISCKFITGQKNRKKHLVITISDTGHGISDSAKDRIFDPFFTTHPEGTGLGLSITHSIIKEHNGFIKVESEEGEGTTFSIFLPILQTNAFQEVA